MRSKGSRRRRAGLRGCPSCLLGFALHPPGAPPRPPERRLWRAARAKGPACGRARGGAPKEHSAAFYAPGGAGGPQAPASSPKATSRSKHRNVPKGRFSAEQGEPQASRIVEGRKAAGDRVFDEESPCGAFSPISRSEHWNVPKGRFSAEQGEPQASRIVEGRKAAGDRVFDEESPCGAFFANKPIGTLERPKGTFQCGASSSIFRLYIRSSVITA